MKQESYLRVATYLWTKVATESSSSQLYIDKKDVEDYFNIKLTNELCEEILNVMYENFDVLDCEYNSENEEFDIVIGTNYTLQYDDTGFNDYVDYNNPNTYFEAEENN